MCLANCRDAHVWSGSDVIVIRHPYNIRTWSDFHSECRKNFAFALVLHTLSDWSKKTRPFSQPIRSQKPKPIMIHSGTFSRALRRLRVFASSLYLHWIV